MFKGRRLKPYSEPVSASALVEGKVYFMVHFFDTQLLVPRLEPLVFLGRNLSPGDVARVYFQDYGSYQRGLRFEHINPEEPSDPRGRPSADLEKGTFLRQKDDQLGFIFEYERALEELMSCSLRRMKQPQRPKRR